MAATDTFEKDPSTHTEPHAEPATQSELTWRLLQLLNVYRVVVALFLLVLFSLSEIPRFVGSTEPELFIGVSVAYLVFGAFNAILVQNRWVRAAIQIHAQLIIDITCVTLLVFASGGVSSGLGNLLVVSIGAAGLIAPGRTAVLAAAVASIALLAEQALGQFGGTMVSGNYTQTGLLGAVLLIITWAAYPVNRRIRESEALARQRGVDLANLAELNEYIIQHLRESIVVVDHKDRIRVINESATHILVAGTAKPVPGQHLADISPRLHAILNEYRDSLDTTLGAPPSTFVAIDDSTVVTPHFASLGKSDGGGMLIFLEDTSLLAERVQQTKLASLGRLSASIAHEIRNPVGAMSHAGQLLGESANIGPEERRLTGIIHTNADRISAIVENVLQLSRRDSTQPERLNLATWSIEFMDEFRRTLQISPELIRVDIQKPTIEVRMDPTHLHQVVWNLCDNAIKFSSEGNVDVCLRIGRVRSTGRPFMEVADKGPGINERSVVRIFEPFFTEGSGGTGLGLFISRELCECNRATLLYEPRDGGGSLFRIIFSDPQRWEM